MLKNFRSSPLWLIGLFIIFAEGTAGVAAINVGGRPQEILVYFVISYSSIVTFIFFIFLWFKPENFYGPGDYGDISPEQFTNAIRGLPSETTDAVKQLEKNPQDEDALFGLMSNLLTEETKQHLILMRKNGDELDISNINEKRILHRYEFITKNGGVNLGVFSPHKFIQNLNGTELIRASGDRKKLFLTSRGKEFADWLVKHQLDAETFSSEAGRWGKEQSAIEFMKDRFDDRSESNS